MNVFQKAAILAVRFYAFIMFMYGVLGLVELGYLFATGHPDPYARERVVASIVWLVVGALGSVIASALGRWLGRGLG